MENEKPLKACALVRKLSNAIKNNIHNLFSDCVVTTCIVVCSIFLATDQLFGMKKLVIGTCTHLIYKKEKQSQVKTCFRSTT